MAFDDHIVNEVRKSRELILEQFKGDLDKFFKFIREEESKNHEKLASIPPAKGLSPQKVVG
ncbi:hypothetical protein Desku_1719 [Desulfofundulus kuznetsovii DSM 6115]|uniref:Uncharacterized protein n=1 Tax=Desulfofundulus kuznetsovii (strain DSM 6115 / VKM B-1805 / 17) TaxID=760568 RepID=A0AAU8PTK6_DESK7|nr:hypothetical protein Desku_1719 [Desulfofundulus kuznetsovii DSM 6115]